jgi:uncharacterized protein YndB with AHSA1/START domain
MGFPDRIERTVDLPHPPQAVWTALTTAAGLGAWFGEAAEIDLRPGGAGRLVWAPGTAAEEVREFRVERVEAPAAFAFTWVVEGLPAGDPRRTFAEFTLEPTTEGTRLRVVETGFAQLPDSTYGEAYDGHTAGWARELGELAEHLDAA